MFTATTQHLSTQQTRGASSRLKPGAPMTAVGRAAGLVALAVALLLSLVVTDPASAALPQPRESETYIGEVEGTDAFAAIVVRRGKAIAYVCDSDGIAVWFSGTYEDSQLSLKATSGATYEGTFASSTVSLPGEEPLYATVKRQSGKARLKIGVGTVGGKRWAGGWITLHDGRQRGARKSGDIILGGPAVTSQTSSVPVPGGSLGVVDYLKDWDKIPKVAQTGGAPTF